MKTDHLRRKLLSSPKTYLVKIDFGELGMRNASLVTDLIGTTPCDTIIEQGKDKPDPMTVHELVGALFRQDPNGDAQLYIRTGDHHDDYFDIDARRHNKAESLVILVAGAWRAGGG